MIMWPDNGNLQGLHVVKIYRNAHRLQGYCNVDITTDILNFNYHKLMRIEL